MNSVDLVKSSLSFKLPQSLVTQLETVANAHGEDPETTLETIVRVGMDEFRKNERDYEGYRVFPCDTVRFYGKKIGGLDPCVHKLTGHLNASELRQLASMFRRWGSQLIRAAKELEGIRN